MRAKADEAEAFLRRENWHVGVWEIREAGRTGELTIRPDGQYTAKDEDAFFREIVRGRDTRAPRRIHLFPCVGPDVSAHSNGEFGKVERPRELASYDGA